MNLRDVDLKQVNPAQMLKTFEDHYKDHFKVAPDPLISAGFVAGMCAGLGMGIFQEPTIAAKHLFQCQDIAETRAQLAEMGMPL